MTVSALSAFAPAGARRFDFTESDEIARHIQAMVYARPERALALTGLR